MSVKVTERSFYPFIITLLKGLTAKHNVAVSGVSEVSVSGRTFPDVLTEIDGHKILIQVKIGAPERLIEDIVKTYSPARSLGADIVGILFPEAVRQIPPDEFEKVYPELTVTRGLILTSWQSQDAENVTLSNLLDSIIRAYVDYRRTLTPIVDYSTVAKIARETVEELAVILRGYVGVERYSNAVSVIVGRFDYYRAMLEDFLSEEEMKIYMADITAYLLTLQLLFLHIISKRIYKTDIIPKIDNPLETPKDLIEQLIKAVEGSSIIKDYYKVLGALLPILEILREIANQDPRISLSLAKYIYVLYPLKPESIKEELFGRIYQLGLPPETRKNLGAFFTKPEAAKLLASLAVERWDEKVLDPACGSGTLLAESYQAKAKLTKKQAILGLEKNLIEDLVGIDIMHFARELTSINLALQNPSVRVNPKVFMGDGIEKMVFAQNIDDPPVQMPIYSFLENLKAEYEALVLPREGIDIVIMNPPFTRRERIPEKERERLDKLLGDVVKGKVGYSLYFFAAADNMIKLGGKLATVTPEEFFAGGSAESVRRFLFSEKNRIYIPKYVVRSAAEIAFSEGAHYRDYLTIFKKQRGVGNEDAMVFVILRKKLAELNLEKVVEKILEFSKSNEERLSDNDISARKIHNISYLISKHISNLKPLVGLSYIKAQELIMELLEDLSRNPTLKEYEDDRVISLRDYTCQHITLGVEEYIRRLFISKYGGRGKISFIYRGEDKNNLFFCIRRGQKYSSSKIDKASCVYSLRSPAKVVHMNITDEEEYAIIDTKNIPDDILRLAGLVDKRKVREAVKDIKSAYEDLAGNILLVRRARVTSPNIFWLAFLSERKIIGPSAPMICLQTDLNMENSKLLTLCLNSTVTLLQLLGFAVETEGAWIAFQGDRVWSNIHLPDFNGIAENIRNEALKMFNEIGKLNVNNLYQRIKEKNSIQRSIDLISLKLLGLDDPWANRLDEIYDSILGELNIMQRILEESSKKSGIKRRDEEEIEEKQEKQEILNAFFKD